MKNGIWFTRSRYWGSGVWFAHEANRDLGRVSQDEEGWQGWRDKYPGPPGSSNKPDVKGVRTRQEAAEALHDLWNETHGPAAPPGS